jgi:ATP-dependent DNA ligase
METGAVHAALDGIEALRKTLPAADIRPALPSNELPDGSDWLRELKLDGYRAVAFLQIQVRGQSSSSVQK